MAKTEAQKGAEQRYRERNPDKVEQWWRTQEEKRGYRDRAEYMREYRRRKKAESSQVEPSQVEP